MKGVKTRYAYASYILMMILMPVSFRAAAQIVNTESARMQSDTTGWKGSTGSSFSVIKNIRQILQLDLNAHLQYKTKKDLYLILGNYTFLSAGRQLINNTFFHFRYNRKINDYLRWEIFTQLQSNVITGIQGRFLAGTGPRFKIASTKRFRLYAATLVMYEEEKERDAGKLHRDVRNSSYASFSIIPSDRLELVSTSFYQPLLHQFGDFRILNQETLKVSASEKLAFTLNWNYLYDSYPAKLIPSTNYTFSTGFNYAF